MNNMKFVYSNICLTDNPLFSCNKWLNVDFYLSTIVLSVLQTKKLYKDNTIEFIGDKISIELFNKLNLPFDVIKDDLESIKSYPKDFWALGKIKAYQLQTEKFIHLDTDVILRKKLDDFDNLLFQNKEENSLMNSWFTNMYSNQIKVINTNGYKVKSWGKANYAVNSGIYGCKNLEFNVDYTTQVFDFIINNKNLLLQQYNVKEYAIVFEQYLFACLIEDRKIKTDYISNPFNTDDFIEKGFLHIWGAKNKIEWYEYIRNWIIKDYPFYYETIQKILKDNKLK